MWWLLLIPGYVVVGLVASISIYVTHHGDRKENEIISDLFFWPVLVVGAIFVLSAGFVRSLGDRILKLRKK
jgi:hypothetical protein